MFLTSFKKIDYYLIDFERIINSINSITQLIFFNIIRFQKRLLLFIQLLSKLLEKLFSIIKYSESCYKKPLAFFVIFSTIR